MGRPARGRRIERGGRRCGRRVGRRWRGGSIGSGSGRRSLAGCRARTPAVEAGVSPAVGVRWFREGGGMPSVSAGPGCRGGTCRSPSVRRSRSCAPAGAGCARSRVSSAGRRRRSRGSCAATRRPAAAGSSTGPRRRSGMPTGGPGGRRPRSWPPTSGCASYVQDRLSGAVHRAGRRPVSGPGGALDRPAARPAPGPALGDGRGARSRSPTGCGSTSPMMSRCGSRTRRSTRRSTSRAAARCGAS